MSVYLSREKTIKRFQVCRTLLKQMGMPHRRRIEVIESIKQMSGAEPDDDLDNYLERFIADRKKTEVEKQPRLISNRPLSIDKMTSIAHLKASAVQPVLISCTSNIGFTSEFIYGEP